MAFEFQTVVARQFAKMSSSPLYQIDIEKDLLWETYLKSFPSGSDPIFRKRTEHDCSCCKHFVRTVGGLVAIKDGKVETIWDGKIDGPYGVVAEAMQQLVRSRPIQNIFLHYQANVGSRSNVELLEDNSVKTFDHFHITLPYHAVAKKLDIGPRLSDYRATFDVAKRSLCEISLESVDTVLELIGQNSLYRGAEHQAALTHFRKLKTQFHKIVTDVAQDLFVWEHCIFIPQSISRIRNTAIGTLLTDLSNGVEIEDAVKAFESKVAPTNYKRPTALVTKAMVQKAQQKIEELGLMPSLQRRYATIEDITINNILFADRSAKKELNVFEEIAQTTPTQLKKFEKVEEVGIEDFITKILPTAHSLEVLVENRHLPNLVSLVAPQDMSAPTMFKWPNAFSWSYNNDLADSIKERVKAAGGKVVGDLRVSLSWFNSDDLDLHMNEPYGSEIWYAHKYSPATGGQLDVDMNAGSGKTRTPVENIIYPTQSKMKDGTYVVGVHNFCKRESLDVGFEVEVEFDGQIHTFAYTKAVRDKEYVEVCEIKLKNGKFELGKSLPSTSISKSAWGLATQQFHKVRVMMLSPNYWDGHGVGNKHYMFVLDGCANDKVARGFFNEFLHPSLEPHRKVLEMVGAKMHTEQADKQLSGLGFSSTQKNNLLVKVGGAFERVVRIVF